MSATINATYILPFPSLFPVTSSSNLLISIKQKIFSIGNFIQKELIIFFAKSFQKKIITTKKNIHMKYIIIGGVAGGATAAARIRRNTEKAEIILFEKGEYISYANCGLPYYIGGVIEDRERLFVQTPESFGKRFNIDIRTRSEVTAIDVKKKEVTVRSSGKTYTESYDKLLLSPGASPVRPPLPGIDTEGIFTLRNVNDTDRIKSYMQQKAVKRAVIVGGGFIGLEMAENLHHSGIEVSVVEMANQVMGPIDYSMASLVHEHLQQKGVRLYLEQAVESFEKTAEGISVHFKSGIQVNAEMVLLSIGVRAETRLATEAGLKLGGNAWHLCKRIHADIR